MATIEDVSERRRVDAVRTDFVANISHELKTPVGALAVLAETLATRTTSTSSTGSPTAWSTRRTASARTIDDLLELSRIELGEEPVRDVVDVADVVDGAVTDARRRRRAARHHDRDASRSRPSVRVTGDRRQLVSALGNLVENASSTASPAAACRSACGSTGEWVELMVADHGIGIPASDHDRIFERFYRVDQARSRDTGGTGLGLSIVRHVATNHGGEVLVSSQEGEGSTFVLRIPAAGTGESQARWTSR